MARTKQTARKSTGGKAPRTQLACGYTRSNQIDEDMEPVDIPNIDEDTAAELKAIEEGEMRAELKHIDKKYTEKGQPYYVETVEEIIPDQVNWWNKFALCVVHHISRGSKSAHEVYLQVNSPHLKDILRKTIPSYPGLSFDTKEISIHRPYHVLFHYRHELEAASSNLEDDSMASEHLNLLLLFIKEEFKEVIAGTENLLEQGLVRYSYLWTLFRPQSDVLVYTRMLGQPRVFTLLNYSYVCDPPSFQLRGQIVDFDGENFGTRDTNRSIDAFQGTARIDELAAYPLEWHKNPAAIRQVLIDRGRRFEELATMSFCCYKGVAIDSWDRYNVDGRVVVDPKTFHRINPISAFSVNAFKPKEGRLPKRARLDLDEEGDEGLSEEYVDLLDHSKPALDALTDDQCLLATSTVRGFSFTEKKWFDFFIDNLSPADWNPQAFDQLVLPAEQKDLVRALVETHSRQSHKFDDIVKGKGKGLIMVLHGPPGVGKTLTAETVAEYCKRPLYTVSSADLGTKSTELDKRLGAILDMASTWKAVLLIDEADVFLEARSLHEMERNSLVSIFLRVLEYYSGILFLTSNRVSTFDSAFKSRIHVPLKYNDLTVDARTTIWKNFLKQVDEELQPLSDADYKALAAAPINGRQIKNIVRTASSLAQYRGKLLDRQMLEQVINIQLDFEEEMDKDVLTVVDHP